MELKEETETDQGKGAKLDVSSESANFGLLGDFTAK